MMMTMHTPSAWLLHQSWTLSLACLLSADPLPCNGFVDQTGLQVWDASLALMRHMTAHTAAVACAQNVLELGAGTGGPGLLAAQLGARRVLLTDHNSEVGMR